MTSDTQALIQQGALARPAVAEYVDTEPDATAVGPELLTASPGRVYGIAKRSLDITMATTLLLLLSPIIALIALTVYLTDRGSIFFSQKRTGMHGERFTLWKFRTMCPDAEAMQAELQHLSTVAYPDFKLDHDPRITAIGRFLRATYLDELPQLINVLRGDMSLVGPRPTSFAPSTYDLWHTERLEVRPGITGLWQVHRSSDESSFDERLRLDIQYVRNRSFGGDLQLIFETFARQIRFSGR